MGPDEGAFMQAAFRKCSTGHVVRTGAFHDLSLLPDGEDADLDDWEAGFTDSCGRFFTRREAAAAIGVSGSLESRSYVHRLRGHAGEHAALPHPRTLDDEHRDSYHEDRGESRRDDAYPPNPSH